MQGGLRSYMDLVVGAVVDGKVTGVGSGLATVTASYEGKTYKCIIHVN